MTSQAKTIKFTAFNNETGEREEFECNYLPGLHARKEDAAESCLWYGQHWSRSQMHSAKIEVQE